MTEQRQSTGNRARVRVSVDDITKPVPVKMAEDTEYWERVRGRMAVRLFESYSQEVHRTSWVSVSDFKEDFETWMIEVLGGELTDEQVESIPVILGVFSAIEHINPEVLSTMLERGGVAETRKRRRRGLSLR